MDGRGYVVFRSTTGSVHGCVVVWNMWLQTRLVHTVHFVKDSVHTSHCFFFGECNDRRKPFGREYTQYPRDIRCIWGWLFRGPNPNKPTPFFPYEMKDSKDWSTSLAVESLKAAWSHFLLATNWSLFTLGTPKKKQSYCWWTKSG